MPTILILGLSELVAGSDAFEGLRAKQLPKAATSVPAMGIEDKMVKTFAPRELEYDPKQGVIVRIGPLFDRPERTLDALEQFAATMLECIVAFVCDYMPECGEVGLYAESQGPHNVFLSWERPVEA